MSDSTRFWLSTALTLAALGWWVVAGVFVRGAPDNPSALRFWLWVTAPLVGIALLVAAILILIHTERLRRDRGVAIDGLTEPPLPVGGSPWHSGTSTSSASPRPTAASSTDWCRPGSTRPGS